MKTTQNHLPQFPHLREEEHIYRGPMLNYRKHGDGIYIIVKKFSDNSEKVKSVKGEWIQDILKSGTLTDETGKEQFVTSNVLKMSMRSKKLISPYLEKNATIERIREKTLTIKLLGQLPLATDSGHSVSSIQDKHKLRGA